MFTRSFQSSIKMPKSSDLSKSDLQKILSKLDRQIKDLEQMVLLVLPTERKLAHTQVLRRLKQKRRALCKKHKKQQKQKPVSRQRYLGLRQEKPTAPTQEKPTAPTQEVVFFCYKCTKSSACGKPVYHGKTSSCSDSD